MAETNTVPNSQKALSLESFEEASKLLATKDEVKEQIAEAISTCASITFASTEEILALFKPVTSETPAAPEEGV